MDNPISSLQNSQDQGNNAHYSVVYSRVTKPYAMPL